MKKIKKCKRMTVVIENARDLWIDYIIPIQFSNFSPNAIVEMKEIRTEYYIYLTVDKVTWL